MTPFNALAFPWFYPPMMYALCVLRAYAAADDMRKGRK